MRHLSFGFLRMNAIAAFLFSIAAVGRAAPPQTGERGDVTFCKLPATGMVEFSPADSESSVPAHFQLTSHRFDFTTKPTPIIENNTVHGVYFQPAGHGPYPACVVLHILGGDFLLAEAVANHLASNGVAALFIKMPYYGERRGKNSRRRMIAEDPHETAAGMTQAVLDIRRAAAWLASREEVDPNRLESAWVESCRHWGPLGSRGFEMWELCLAGETLPMWFGTTKPTRHGNSENAGWRWEGLGNRLQMCSARLIQ
jgi:hypothetical protein